MYDFVHGLFSLRHISYVEVLELDVFSNGGNICFHYISVVNDFVQDLIDYWIALLYLLLSKL